MTLVRRRFRGMAALVALVTAIALVATASPAMAQGGGTSTVTQADCDAGRIKNKEGETLRGEACERLIGQRVRLAQTGFEAWWLLLGGVALMGGGVALRMRRGGPATPQLG